MIGLILVFSVFAGTNTLMPYSVSAATPPPATDPCNKSFLGLPTWYKYLEVGEYEGDPCAIKGPNDGKGGLDFEQALPLIVLAVIEILLRIAGMVAVGFVIFGGFKYITAQAEPDKLAQAQSTIINALIGLAIAVMAVTVVNFLGGAIL
jgi:hypothetical protein